MIRKMEITDLPSIQSLLQAIPYFWHDYWTPKTLAKAFTTSSALHFVYEINFCIVGCIFAYDLGFRAYIAELAVSEESRNLGIGKILLSHVESILKEQKCELIIADIWENAEPFYRKLGWEQPNAVLMRKRLVD